MDYLFVILHGLFAIFILTIPGMAIVLCLSRRRTAEWPFALLLAGSFVFSSLLIAGLQFLSLSLLNPTASRVIAYLFVLGTLVCFLRIGHSCVSDAINRMGVWERRAFSVIIAVMIFWLVAMPLSPYPSQISMQLGDPPVYYRTAANLVAGKGWVPDYFIADYPGGELSYVRTHPVAVLVTTHFLQILGTNWYSLYIYDLVAAGIIICLLASLIQGGYGATHKDGRDIFFLSLAFALLPAHFVLFGLGVITAPGALAFLTAVAFSITHKIPRKIRHVIIGASLLLMLWLRPESAFLALLTAVVCGVAFLLTRKQLNRMVRAAILVICLFALAILWLNLPSLVDILPSSWRGLSVYYLKFDGGHFLPLYNSWWYVNSFICEKNFLGVGLDTLGNTRIAWQMREHPIAFLQYLFATMPTMVSQLVRAMSVAEYRPEWNMEIPALAIAVVLMVLAYTNPSGKRFVTAVILFLLLMPAINRVAGVRHMLTVSPALLALSLKPLWRRWSYLLGRITSNRWLMLTMCGLMATLTFIDCFSIVKIRTSECNRSYVTILRDIQRITSPDDVIASSYPQLITCMTGRKCIGGTWMTESIDIIVKNYQPDFIILIDNAPDGPASYSLLAMKGGSIPGYVPVVNNIQGRYAIFRSMQYHGIPGRVRKIDLQDPQL